MTEVARSRADRIEPNTSRAITPPDRTMPSKEAIEYGRRVIQPVHDLLKTWEQKCRDEGRPDDAARHRFAAFMIQTRFLGHDDGGCVVTSFDLRWLDDNFREMWQGVLDSIAEKEANRG